MKLIVLMIILIILTLVPKVWAEDDCKKADRWNTYNNYEQCRIANALESIAKKECPNERS